MIKKVVFIGWCVIVTSFSIVFWAGMLHRAQTSLINLGVISPIDIGDEWHSLFGGVFLLLSPITAYCVIVWIPKHLKRIKKNEI